LELYVPDPAAFASDPLARAAVVDAISKSLGVRPADVEVELSVKEFPAIEASLDVGMPGVLDSDQEEIERILASEASRSVLSNSIADGLDVLPDRVVVPAVSAVAAGVRRLRALDVFKVKVDFELAADISELDNAMALLDRVDAGGSAGSRYSTALVGGLQEVARSSNVAAMQSIANADASQDFTVGGMSKQRKVRVVVEYTISNVADAADLELEENPEFLEVLQASLDEKTGGAYIVNAGNGAELIAEENETTVPPRAGAIPQVGAISGSGTDDWLLVALLIAAALVIVFLVSIVWLRRRSAAGLPPAIRVPTALLIPMLSRWKAGGPLALRATDSAEARADETIAGVAGVVRC